MTFILLQLLSHLKAIIEKGSPSKANVDIIHYSYSEYVHGHVLVCSGYHGKLG